MAACSSACGYCGRCTDAWERPLLSDDLPHCDTCGVSMPWTIRQYQGPIRIVLLGDFCSERCANEASEQHARAMQHRPLHSSTR